MIEANVFTGCGLLKEIIVPNGTRDVFVKQFGLPEDKVVEGRGHVEVTKHVTESSLEYSEVNLFHQRRVQLMRFSYNARYFYWAVGDEVNLKDVFSGPITLVGGVTYEFRRKALFVFIKSATAKGIEHAAVYELPANTISFTNRFQDKYANRSPRIFIFECDDGKTARVFDEVRLARINKDTIMVKTLLRV